MTNYLVHFDKARQELELAASLDEVRDIRNKAEALRIYLKQAGESLAMQNRCAEIKIRAERKAGEILQETGRKRGETDKAIRSRDDSIYEELPPTLHEMGVTPTQSHRWQLIASIPEEKFEQHVETIKAEEKELTTSGTLKLAFRLKKDEARQSTLESDEEISLPANLEILTGDFRSVEAPENSIDLIFTMPVYEKGSLGTLVDLGAWSFNALKPGGSLIVYCPAYDLVDAVNYLSQSLRFWWVLAGEHSGQSTF